MLTIDILLIDELGKLSAENCENAVYMAILKGSEPKEQVPCTMTKQTIKNWFLQWFQ